MVNQIFMVSALSEVSQLNAQGKAMPKRTIVLQSPGRFGDKVMATMLGEECQMPLMAGDLVLVELHMSLHEYEGRQYQDIMVRSILKLGSAMNYNQQRNY